MVPLDRLEQITQRFEYIEAQMTQGGGDIAQLGREYAELRPVVEEIRAYRQALSDIEARAPCWMILKCAICARRDRGA